jgi:hypothetical protein
VKWTGTLTVPQGGVYNGSVTTGRGFVRLDIRRLFENSTLTIRPATLVQTKQ